MRQIIVRIEIDDNDIVEQALFNELQETLGHYMKDFQKLPDTDDLYQTDQTFRHLSVRYKAAKKAYRDYIYKPK